ncbi:pirin family protein [Marinimicrobium sp. C6131]|uniref:pirin family protein n=1 Tax=Marinimicrobium sp. C6131 TaxID=3022676 RepID=UPI00223D4E56|nr:pirin family protein [Marinimicrobium sp. C6131]UZJ43396.1 pirin family protein [Marinimicrobium sp. C6131]
MTNTEWPGEPGSSLECPKVDGRYEIQRVTPRAADVGGIPVNRILPRRQRRTVGAWCFLDHAGPSHFPQDAPGFRVGPHPHIGLQTFTWMIEGEVLHRDSLGSEQVVRPGQVNLMTAGHGIAHTEEATGPEPVLHAAQLWIALPKAHKDTAPRFDHYPELPRWQERGVDATLLVGEYAERQAPTLSFSPLVAVEFRASEAAEVALSLRAEFEYGLVALEGEIQVEGEAFAANHLAYIGGGRDAVRVHLAAGTRLLMLGGEPLGEEILIWWNFVGHSREEIAEAQDEWETGSERFGSVPGYEGDPLPAPPIPWRS